MSQANSSIEGGTAFAALIGPALAGALIPFIGAPNVLYVDAATYFVAFLLSWRSCRGASPSQRRSSTASWPAFASSSSDKLLAPMAATVVAFGFLSAGMSAGLPVYAYDEFDGSSWIAGLFYTALGAGALVGSLARRASSCGRSLRSDLPRSGSWLLDPAVGAPVPAAVARGLRSALHGDVLHAARQRADHRGAHLAHARRSAREGDDGRDLGQHARRTARLPHRRPGARALGGRAALHRRRLGITWMAIVFAAIVWRHTRRRAAWSSRHCSDVARRRRLRCRVRQFRSSDLYAPMGDQPRAIGEIAASVAEGNRFQTILGATGTGKTATMAWTIEKLQRPALVIAHNKTLAAQLCNEFREFFPENAVEYFVSYYDYFQPEAYIPQADLYIEKDSSQNDDIARLRLSATSSLLTRRDVVVVASVSCIYGLGSPEEWRERVLMLEVGEEHDRDAVLRKLIESQYVRNDTVLGRGRFRVKGDLVEIQPANVETAYRVSFFGDTVEQMTHFDPLTGEVTRSSTTSSSGPRPSTSPRSRRSSAQSTSSARSSSSRWRSSRPRAGCSRRTGSASARSTTSR